MTHIEDRKKGSVEHSLQVVDKEPLRGFVYHVIKNNIVLVLGKRNELKLYTLRRSKSARNMTFLAFRYFETWAQHLGMKFRRELLSPVLSK